ncbi:MULTISPECIES: WD40 repeat domain-containing protein [Leptolyngbya]|uniref:WD40 repeat domain-containing protein n=1 Tax=Leptolyngbya TaxID=47251 RepID=UPI001688F487|nr:WD40 repeat domain-containing protein [Leptolyngbya sp. FACHB-1624]MBD1857660.1 WD40 repeat domain-containing protein [Leptolyngbya sp. FACHB-1624]
MEFEQALEIISGVFNHTFSRSLTEVEVALLFGVWNNLTYDLIAERSGYSINYLQHDVGPKFWKLLSQALKRKVNKTNLRTTLTHFHSTLSQCSIQVQPAIDWGESPDVSIFHGRTEEIEYLSQWITDERCRLVGIVGMGGIGKSVLAAQVARQVQEEFDVVIWRSLRNAPSLDSLLSELVPFVSKRQDIQAKPERLLYWLQRHRCLVILDNQETLLQAGKNAGYYRSDFMDYGNLFQMLGESSHQSCILLTSREKSAEVALLEESEGAIRSLFLEGSCEASLALLDAKRLVGTLTEKCYLCELYRCNPLAVKMVATSIQSLFDGEITAFLQVETPLFNGIRRLLEQQFERLSVLEQTIMYWLAINREWTTITELQADIIPAISRASLLEALESLTWRSLIEKRSGEYTQQPVVMEYVTDCFIQRVVTELLINTTSFFNDYALIKTTALDYIRESQIRLILQPIIAKLRETFHHNAVVLEQHLRSILVALRSASEPAFNYGAGNLINLCLHSQIDLAGYDFSGLVLRYADLQGATLQDINFQLTHFSQSTFTQTFAGGVWVQFSPDGQRFAIGDTNGCLHFWQFQEMQPLFTVQAHQSWILAAAWHPNGTTLATGVGPIVRLWDTRTGQWLRNFMGFTDCVFTLVWSPDGQQLACGGQEPSILIWDTATGTERTRLGTTEQQDHRCWIWSLVWLASGTLLAGAYTDCTIKIWDIASGNCIRVIQAHEYWVLSLALHPDGKILASSGMDRTIKLWDWQTGECLQAIATRDYVWRLEWSPDGQKLAGGSDDHTVTLWDRSLKCLQVFPGHQSWVWGVAWSRDGKTLATVSHDHVMKLWNTHTGCCIKTLQGHSNSSWCVKWSKDGTRLLSGNTNHTVQLWDCQTGQCLRQFYGHTKEVLFVAWSPDECLIASCSADTTVRIWDVRTGQCLTVLIGHERWVKSVAWSLDGTYVISSSNDQTLKLWDIHSGQCLLTLSEHQHQVNSVAWFPTSHRVASASLDQTIRFWDLSRGVCDRILPVGHSVHSIAFSPNGQTLASGDYESTVKLWDVNSGRCLSTLRGHAPGHLYSVTWSADGKQLASACTDSTIRIWNVGTGDCEQVIEGKNWGTSVDWNPRKTVLAIAYFEQPIQLWDGQMRKTIQTLRSKLPYEGMKISGVTGLSEAQKANLKALGAVE